MDTLASRTQRDRVALIARVDSDFKLTPRQGPDDRLACYDHLARATGRPSFVEKSCTLVLRWMSVGASGGAHGWCGQSDRLSQDQISGAASHLGFISLPHFFGSSLCIFSIRFATSGWLSITCFVMTFTISSQDEADSFWSHAPPSSLQVITFIGMLAPYEAERHRTINSLLMVEVPIADPAMVPSDRRTVHGCVIRFSSASI
jgi:hypothetical protein